MRGADAQSHDFILGQSLVNLRARIEAYYQDTACSRRLIATKTVDGRATLVAGPYRVHLKPESYSLVTGANGLVRSHTGRGRGNRRRRPIILIPGFICDFDLRSHVLFAPGATGIPRHRAGLSLPGYGLLGETVTRSTRCRAEHPS